MFDREIDLGKSVAIIGTRGFPSYYGGFETAVRELAPYLVQRGWDVTVYGRANAIRVDDPLAASDVQSVVTPGLDIKALSTLSFGATASLHAMRRRPDVALVMNVANGFYLPWLKRRGIPTLVNVDGIEWLREKWGKAARRVFYQGALATAKHADDLVFDAHAIGDFWRSEFNRDGVYIPYGGRFREDLPVEPGLSHRGYVLMVARFVPENTVGPFFDAARNISSTWPVVIVGSSGYGGDLEERARLLAATSPNTRWLGHVSDDDRLHALWQHAGAYFHGHSVGGTNPALVQAMALGAPIIARDTVYNREVLGEGALLIAPTSEAISASVASVLADTGLQERLSRDAIRRAREVFTWDKVNRLYEESLTKLVRC